MRADKVIQLHKAFTDRPAEKKPLTALKSFYLFTPGAARALDLDDRIGSFKAGNEAGFVVLNPNATALLKFRPARTTTLEEKLFVLQTLGDDRAVERTYIMGTRQ